MPYKKSNPPDRIKSLPKGAQSIWVSAYNSAYKNYDASKTDKDKEGYANSVAWSAVKRKYKKEGDKWVKKGNEFGFSIDVSELKFAEGQKETMIQVLPQGKWQHPTYGEINIKQNDLREFVRNFENGVRNDIPITEGHSIGGEEKPAIGWFKELVNKGRQGLWAIVEWTKKGRKLIEDKAYKYFSPEFYSTYEDPQTHSKHNNVLVGGALTNKPYFKELAMVLSEQAIDMKLSDIVKKEANELTDEEVGFLKEQEDLTDEVKQKFEDALEEEEEEEEEEESEAEEEEEEEEEKKEGSENVMISASVLQELEKNAEAGMEAKQELTEMKIKRETNALMFSESNRKGKLLPKSRGKVKAFLSSLTEGQRKQFKEILDDLPSAKLFSELGDSEDESKSAKDKLDNLAKKKMSENSELRLSKAYSQVFAENPELAKELGYGK